MGINLVFRIIRNPFRFYLHPPRAIARLLAGARFALHSVKDTAIWRIAVFTASAAAARSPASVAARS